MRDIAICGCLVWLMCCLGCQMNGQALQPLLKAADKDVYVGSKTCAACHAGIAVTYSATPMANASGVVDASAAGQPQPGTFQQASTGAEYRILKGPGGFYLEYEKTLSQGRQISGKKHLDYFVSLDGKSRKAASIATRAASAYSRTGKASRSRRRFAKGQSLANGVTGRAKITPETFSPERARPGRRS